MKHLHLFSRLIWPVVGLLFIAALTPMALMKDSYGVPLGVIYLWAHLPAIVSVVWPISLTCLIVGSVILGIGMCCGKDAFETLQESGAGRQFLKRVVLISSVAVTLVTLCPSRETMNFIVLRTTPQAPAPNPNGLKLVSGQTVTLDNVIFEIR